MTGSELSTLPTSLIHWAQVVDHPHGELKREPDQYHAGGHARHDCHLGEHTLMAESSGFPDLGSARKCFCARTCAPNQILSTRDLVLEEGQKIYLPNQIFSTRNLVLERSENLLLSVMNTISVLVLALISSSSHILCLLYTFLFVG